MINNLSIGVRLCLVAALTLAAGQFTYGQSKKAKGRKGQPYTVNSVWVDDNPAKAIYENADVTVDDSHVEFEFLTEEQGGEEACEVWFRNYKGIKPIDEIPAVDRPPGGHNGATTDFHTHPSGKRWWGKESPFLACVELDPPTVGTNNNTAVFWAYYKYDDENYVRYYRLIYHYEAKLPPGITRVVFNRKRVMREDTVTVKNIRQPLRVFTSKIDGRPAWKVKLKVEHKHIPIKRVPRTPPAGAKEVSGIVFDRGLLRQWPFFVDRKDKKGILATETTVMLWAVYRSANSTQCHRFVFYINGPGKKK